MCLHHPNPTAPSGLSSPPTPRATRIRARTHRARVRANGCNITSRVPASACSSPHNLLAGSLPARRCVLRPWHGWMYPDVPRFLQRHVVSGRELLADTVRDDRRVLLDRERLLGFDDGQLRGNVVRLGGVSPIRAPRAAAATEARAAGDQHAVCLPAAGAHLPRLRNRLLAQELRVVTGVLRPRHRRCSMTTQTQCASSSSRTRAMRALAVPRTSPATTGSTFPTFSCSSAHGSRAAPDRSQPAYSPRSLMYAATPGASHRVISGSSPSRNDRRTCVALTSRLQPPPFPRAQ